MNHHIKEKSTIIPVFQLFRVLCSPPPPVKSASKFTAIHEKPLPCFSLSLTLPSKVVWGQMRILYELVEKLRQHIYVGISREKYIFTYSYIVSKTWRNKSTHMLKISQSSSNEAAKLFGLNAKVKNL